MEVLIGIFGVVVGAVVGAFLPKILARWGVVTCEAEVVHSVAIGMFGTFEEDKPILPITEDFLPAADITFEIEVDLFNEKEIPTGLRDVSVYAVSGDESLRLYTRKRIVKASAEEPAPLPEPTRTVNLPPGEIVHLKLTTRFTKEALVNEDIKKYENLEFRGKFPSGGLWHGMLARYPRISRIVPERLRYRREEVLREHVKFPDSFKGMF